MRLSVECRHLAALSLLFVPAFATAQTRTVSNSSTTAGHTVAVPSAHAVRRSGAVVMDGALSEDAWSRATPVTEFRQFDPDEGQPATQRTEFRFVFDDAALYVGAKLFDTEGGAGVRTTLVRRDQFLNSDYIEIVIDGFHDHLGRAFFRVNPSGSRADELGIGTSCCDSGWDPIWEAVTRIDPDGWTAEIRIPLNQLRFSTDSVQTWGLQLRRFIHRRNELDQWAFWKRNESGGPSRFGHLEGLELSRAPRSLELLPYVAAKSAHVASADGDPFNPGTNRSARAGMDLKYSLSSNLTLDATFNPDFGQVEVDPAVVNLTAFETTFDEKRPFFVASSGVFGYGGFSCFFCSNASSLSAFYSRRIGRSPTGSDLAYSAGKYAEVPDATTILGAAKVTGRTGNGYTVGLLNAVTNRERARFEREDGTRGTQVVEPLTNYFVGRLKKDFMQGNLVIGGIATSVVRNFEDEFAPRLTKHAELVGGDFVYTWDQRTYRLQGNLALTNVAGDARVLASRQRASARYYQRPDREVRENGFFTAGYDTTATVLRGGGAYMRLSKESGNWMWETAVNVRTPGFEANDLAVLSRADYIWYNANVFRSWRTPTSWYRNFSIITGGQRQVNFEGDQTDAQLQFFVASTTPQFWNWSTFYIWRPSLLDDRLLRGGPMVKRPGIGFYQASVSTDDRRRIIVGLDANRSWNTEGGWGTELSLGTQFRPATNVNVSVGPSWNDSESKFQYVTTRRDPTATAMYGTRYVMSSIRQKQLVFDTRLNVTFRPTMSLELFAQPLLASGAYRDFKEFDAPRSGKYGTYGKDRGTITPEHTDGAVTSYTIDPDANGPAQAFTINNPDFNFRSLRGNIVYRWEYSPGSVLYVAWTHSRADEVPLGDFRLSRDWNALLDSRPDNILLVKASWWIPR
jgi:hypothetical protein